MVKLQRHERDDREDQFTMTVPRSTVKMLGWDDKIEEGEDVEVDTSVTPEKDGFMAREV